MARILLTHSYFYQLDPKQWQFKQPYPPYNTLLAAAYLRDKNFEVILFDCNLSTNPGEIICYLEKEKPDFVVFYDDSFNYLSKMCLTNMRDACFEMIKLSKQFGAKVLVSSSDATDHPEKYLAQGADVVMLGEAENTLLKLVSQPQENWQGIDGIAYLKDGILERSLKKSVQTDLEQFPMPAWDLLDIAKYQKVWQINHGFVSLNVATTRGCPFKCNWCAKPIYGNRYNSRRPNDVVIELKYLMERFNASHFWICDDIFGLKPSWVKEFSLLLKENALKPKLKIQSRADLLLKDETIKELVAAGLDEVWMGAESGSQKILDAMDKGTTVEQIYEASRLLKENGVKVCLFIQYGYLDENAEDIKSTLKMIAQIMPHDIGISVSYPLPGTGFYEKVKQQLQEKQNWLHSNDLEMMYQGTYSKEFYRMLYSYTHAYFRSLKLKDRLRNRMKFSVRIKTILSLFRQIIVKNRLFRKMKLYQLT
ncbi:B12-binding domain-containing radical SAM protein [Nubsella zeaxanthinifaciens]|uniref:B12-binding domain-containing radical SAM protein n=1 Tax=Nubsella zeaxanthinifaciens TaxID=392412 RepID=UPI000DE38D84|nr:radical SAM protein [Nubsella zeaxanthinifaciens]